MYTHVSAIKTNEQRVRALVHVPLALGVTSMR